MPLGRYRQNDDHHIDVYYRLLPEDMPIAAVKVNIYPEYSNIPIVLSEADGVPQEAGEKLHFVWNAKDGSSYRDAGFFRFQLEVTFVGAEKPFKTCIADANPSLPGWQCPPGGLGVNDLVYKHRPVVRIANDEVSEPVDVSFMMQRAKLYRWEWDSIIQTYVQVPHAGNPVSFATMASLNTPEYFFKYVNTNDRYAPPAWTYRVYHRSDLAAHGDHRSASLQYWFFLATSFLPTGNCPDAFWHEGDWEMFQMTIRLGEKGQEDTAELEPYACTASQHYYGQTLKWKQEEGDNPPSSQDQDYISKSEDPMRPIVFIAHKSHAMFFRAGSFKTASGSPTNPQFQYEVPGLLSTPLDVTSFGPTRDTVNADLRHLEVDPLVNAWLGRWGETSDPSVPESVRADGPPSPAYRGPAEKGGPVLIQSNPIGFHNSYLKSSQAGLSIP